VAEPVGHPLLPHAEPFAGPRDRLRLQRCQACGTFPEFPRIACPRCLGELEWVEVSGHGRVFTFGVVRRPHHVRFEPELPIVLAVIELDEGALVISNVVGDDRLETAIGSPVELAAEGTFAPLPQFRLVT
jgi:uncharacterized OB-fold protein